MGAIEVVFGKDALNINLLDIQNLVDKKIEENRILEYKDPDILNHPGNISNGSPVF